MWNVDFKNLIGKTLLEYGHLEPFTNSYHIYNQAELQVLESGIPATFVVLDKFKNKLRAYYITLTPIFTSQKEICGVISRSYDFSMLFWGADKFYSKHKDLKNYISHKELKSFAPRQQQVLVLLSLHFTQTKIAESLNITRGGVSSIIASICKKLGLGSVTVKFLMEKIDKEELFHQLGLPDIEFASCAFWIKQDPNTSLFLETI